MNGIMLLRLGIGFVILAVILCIIRGIYRKTVGQNIKRQVQQEYEKA